MNANIAFCNHCLTKCNYCASKVTGEISYGITVTLKIKYIKYQNVEVGSDKLKK